jgi:predicted AAA+ superfamily ATPase
MKKFYFIDPFIYEVLHQKTGIPIECKYRNVIKESDKASILRNFKEGIVLSKMISIFPGK